MSRSALPPWRPLLRAAREREGRNPQARWLQLATVAADGSPRVRTLVFRGWTGPCQLDLLTDTRSAKAGELADDPRLEIAWLLPRARAQFRLRGLCEALEPAIDRAERLRHWRELRPGGRALWGWPAPGAPLEDGAAWPLELREDMPLPAHFAVLRIAIQQVELLELAGSPHRRRRWCEQNGWAEQALNP